MMKIEHLPIALITNIINEAYGLSADRTVFYFAILVFDYGYTVTSILGWAARAKPTLELSKSNTV